MGAELSHLNRQLSHPSQLSPDSPQQSPIELTKMEPAHLRPGGDFGYHYNSSTEHILSPDNANVPSPKEPSGFRRGLKVVRSHPKIGWGVVATSAGVAAGLLVAFGVSKGMETNQYEPEFFEGQPVSQTFPLNAKIAVPIFMSIGLGMYGLSLLAIERKRARAMANQDIV